ncbi:MAG: glycosyltransferase family 2 protein, partial [Planctomycetes bacterium]|nr:glycosyltransferase family 2 protein [Planctomycetota bacterium]
MKIIGFAQLRNELSNGNLDNFVRSMNEVCDYVYVYDQASDDESREVYEQNKNWIVTYSPQNDFLREIYCKASLMDTLLSDHPDVDWIFWMDGDTILDGRVDRIAMEKMLIEFSDKQGVCIPHYNLWRSDIYYRIDSSYHSFRTLEL